MSTPDQLLVVIDPLARHTDGESVRIAKDVLSAGAASTKVCLPDGPEEFARVLSRRGSRRPVVVGDDRALLRAVAILHRRRELAACALSVVPVGSALGLARSLGVPTGAVAAARAALDGVERRLDLLVDDSDGVVLGRLRIPALPGAAACETEAEAETETGMDTGTGTGRSVARGVGTTGTGADPGAPGDGSGSSGGGLGGAHSWLRAWPQSLVRTLSTRPSRPARGP
ncbi:diacylglycerol kinase family protein, partial [Streptomyces ipomoeae]